MCLFLGMNTRPDVVSVLVLLSYTNYCSQPMNYFELYFFPVKFHLLSSGSRPAYDKFWPFCKVWGQLFSQRSLEKGCCWNWRNVQYFKNGRSDSERRPDPIDWSLKYKTLIFESAGKSCWIFKLLVFRVFIFSVCKGKALIISQRFLCFNNLSKL